MTNKVESINQKLADVLGIEYKTKPVIGFSIKCEVGKLPIVIVEYRVNDIERSEKTFKIIDVSDD